LVEKPGERHDLAKHRHDGGVELRARREAAGQLTPRDELPKLEILGSLVVSRVSAGHALQALAADDAHAPAKRRRLDDRAEAPDVRRDVLAQRDELRGLRRVDAAADPNLVGRDVEVQARALVLW